MTIQLNTDHNIAGVEALKEHVSATITGDLHRFSEHITRVEVHLSDENSHKNGQDDKRCMLEARLKGMQPIAVTCHAGSINQALNGAIDKLKASMDTVLGRLKDH